MLGALLSTARLSTARLSTATLAATLSAATILCGCGLDPDAKPTASAASSAGAEPAVRAVGSPPAIELSAKSALLSGARLAGYVDVRALRTAPLLAALRGAKIARLDDGLVAFRQKCAFELLEGVDAVGFSQTPEQAVVLAAKVAVPLERFMGCLRRLGFEETLLEGRVAGRRGDAVAVAQDGIVVIGPEPEVRLVLASGQPDAAVAERLALAPSEVARLTSSVSRKVERLDARMIATEQRFRVALDLVFSSADDARGGEALVRGIWAKTLEEVAPKSPVAEPSVRTEAERITVELGVDGGADAQLAYLSGLSEIVAHLANAYEGADPRAAASASAAANASAAPNASTAANASAPSASAAGNASAAPPKGTAAAGPKAPGGPSPKRSDRWDL